MSARFIKYGFTLIELLVVISIIGILATLVVANLSSARSRARDAERKSDLKNIQTALRLYYNDYNGYPKSDSQGDIDGCGTAGITACAWGSSWTAGSGPTVYMNTLPQDPLSTSGRSYFYQIGSDTDSYTLSACLENTSDASGVNASVNGTACWAFQVSQ
ncbi:MAG: prepilin-type N-terminal cleavage/methylation domain-containing protein [Candidatus Microgenomates bacterium]|jgi:general secretion pathway protein G